MTFAALSEIGADIAVEIASLSIDADTLLSIPAWSLYALHLRDDASGTEIIVQDNINDGSHLFKSTEPLTEFRIFGSTSASPDTGDLVTAYDDGQIWFQGILPQDIPSRLYPALDILMRVH